MEKEKWEVIIRCTREIDDAMRDEMRSTGASLTYETRFLFMAVVEVQSEKQVEALRALSFVKDAEKSVTGRLCRMDMEGGWSLMEKTSVEEVDVYKISHYYSNDDKQDSLYIKTDKDLEELVEIIAALQFKFEFMMDDSVALSEEHIVELLTTFYGAVDVTEDYKEKYDQFHLDKNQWGVADVFFYKEESGSSKGCVKQVTQIDVFQARESCCGPNCENLIEKHLLKSEAFDVALLKLKQHYEEEMEKWKQA